MKRKIKMLEKEKIKKIMPFMIIILFLTVIFTASAENVIIKINGKDMNFETGKRYNVGGHIFTITSVAKEEDINIINWQLDSKSETNRAYENQNTNNWEYIGDQLAEANPKNQEIVPISKQDATTSVPATKKQETQTATSSTSESVLNSTKTYNPKTNTFIITTGNGNKYTYEDSNNDGKYICTPNCGTYKFENGKFVCDSGNCNKGETSVFDLKDNTFTLAKEKTGEKETAVAAPPTTEQAPPTEIKFTDERLKATCKDGKCTVTADMHEGRKAHEFSVKENVIKELGTDMDMDQFLNVYSELALGTVKDIEKTSTGFKIVEKDKQGNVESTKEVQIKDGKYTVTKKDKSGKETSKTTFKKNGESKDELGGNSYNKNGELIGYTVTEEGYNKMISNYDTEIQKTNNQIKTIEERKTSLDEEKSQLEAEQTKYNKETLDAMAKGNPARVGEIQAELDKINKRINAINDEKKKTETELQNAMTEEERITKEQQEIKTNKNNLIGKEIDLIQRDKDGNLPLDKNGKPIYILKDYKTTCGSDPLCQSKWDTAYYSIQGTVPGGHTGIVAMEAVKGALRKSIPGINKYVDLSVASVFNAITRSTDAARAGSVIWGMIHKGGSDPLINIENEWAERWLEGGKFKAEACKHWLSSDEGKISVTQTRQLGDVLFVDTGAQQTIGAYIAAERSSPIVDPENKTTEYFYKVTYEITAIKEDIKYNIKLKNKGQTMVENIYAKNVKIKKGQSESRTGTRSLVKYSNRTYDEICIKIIEGKENFYFIEGSELCTRFVESNGGMQNYQFTSPEQGSTVRGMFGEEEEETGAGAGTAPAGAEEDTRYQEPNW